MGTLFGTDGIRGRANQYPMTAEMAVRVGRSAAAVLKGGRPDRPVFIGQDTRQSGDMLAQAAAAGVLSAGRPCVRLGVVPTPAVARLVVETGAAAGMVISASHNPFEDNGIKLFDETGRKLGQDLEAAVEAAVLSADGASGNRGGEPGAMRSMPDASSRYRNFLVSAGRAGGGLAGMQLVVDCANGAASRIAPQVLAELGARVTTLADRPDGRNINADCGSEHPGRLGRTVVAERAQAGLAFDGDADRVVAVDETGQVLSGDQILAICAKSMNENGKLKNSRVVTTVMSNLGLGLALQEMGISQYTCGVGDRLVMETMLRVDAILGGEDSGHIIFGDLHTTGDGILSGLRLLAVMTGSGRPLSELARVMTVFPQKLMAVPVRETPPMDQVPEVVAEIAAVEGDLGERGRVLVRYSGTQPVCRVMVEGPSQEETDRYCRRIAEAVRRAIGDRG